MCRIMEIKWRRGADGIDQEHRCVARTFRRQEPWWAGFLTIFEDC